jgi:hypothetical protein
MDQILAEVEDATGKKIGSAFGTVRRRSDTDTTIDVLLLSDRPLHVDLQRKTVAVAAERGLGVALWPVTPGYKMEFLKQRGQWVQDVIRALQPLHVAFVGYPSALTDAWDTDGSFPVSKVKQCADIFAALDTDSRPPQPVEPKLAFERVSPPPPPELPPLDSDREIGRGIVAFKPAKTINDFFGK